MQTFLDIDVQRPESAEFFAAVSRVLRGRLPPDGARRLRAQVRLFLRWFGGRPDQVPPGGAAPFLRMLADGGAPRALMAGFHEGLRSAFDHLHGRSVTAGVRIPASRPRAPGVLGAEEVAAMIAHPQAPLPRLLIGLLYLTGGGVRETLALRWRDVHLDAGRLLLSASPRLAIALPPLLRDAVTELRGASGAARHVFAASPQAAISPRTALRLVTRAARGAGIDGAVTCGSLPLAFAAHLVRARGDVRQLQRALFDGHRSLVSAGQGTSQ